MVFADGSIADELSILEMLECLARCLKAFMLMYHSSHLCAAGGTTDRVYYSGPIQLLGIQLPDLDFLCSHHGHCDPVDRNLWLGGRSVVVSPLSSVGYLLC